MNPNLAVRITSVDETEKGQKKAEERAGKFQKRLEKLTSGDGLTKLGRQAQGLSKLSKLEFGFKSLGEIGEGSKLAGEAVGHLTRNVLTLGGLAPEAFGAVAEGAGVAAAASAAALTAVVGAGVVTYKLGEKWAEAGGKIGRTAKTLGVASDFLQSTRAANERFGVSVDQTDAALDGFAGTLYDAKYGANNLALGALTQLNVKMRQTKDGAVDVAGTYNDVVDAIARQKDPQVQRKLAQVFGLQGVLPAIREGSARLKAEGDDYLKSGAALSDEQVDQAERVEQKTVRLRQHLGALEKRAGMAALPAAGKLADAGVTLLHPGKTVSQATDAIAHGAEALAGSGLEAGRKLVEGAKQAASEIAGAVRQGGGDAASKMTMLLRSIGFSPDQARGAVAGAYAESGLNPNIKNPKSGAYGIGQWLGKRKRQLFEMFGPNPGLDDQLAFLGWELTHSEAAAGAEIKAAPDASSALQAYVSSFMRPAPGAETSGDLKRGEHYLEGKAAAPAKAQVEVTFRGLPKDASVRVAPTPGVDVAANVHRALEGTP